MSPEKKASVIVIPSVRSYDRELASMYQRRSALDSLIASLETYERFRAKSETGRKRKTA